MDVRKVALEGLIRIIEKDKNAEEELFRLSDKVFSAAELYNLVSGTIKHKLTLDYLLMRVSKRSIKNMSLPVRNTLRLALYELEYLKTPDYAVINSYVEIMKQKNSRSAPFVNGVLRNFLRKIAEIKFPDINKEPVQSISIVYSHPEWMVSRWLKNYGLENTVKICQYNNLASKLVIRINTLKISKEKFAKILVENNIPFSDDRIVKDSLILHYHGNIKNLPGFDEGYWVVQGESSQLVSIALDPREGEEILDMCAAPGGKTTHIAALTHDRARITALDINSNRLIRLKDNCMRLDIKSVNTITSDARSFNTKKRLDRILIDAPCSNTGVLVKRSDARWKKTPEDIFCLADMGYKILSNASQLVKTGGIIIYSTCSIEPEENQQLIERFLKENSDFKADKIAPYLPWKTNNDPGYYQIAQYRENIDGFFIARLIKI